MIDAKIIADSLNPDGDRITTFLLTYPRFIHSEIGTHRMLSRNSASSRAIPVERMIEMVGENPAGPVYWAAAQKGMQATREVDAHTRGLAEETWGRAMLDAVSWAKELIDSGIHKAIANRVLEPFAHMTTLVTATEYRNFFALRAHPDAQQEFQLLAYRMLGLYLAGEPEPKAWEEWHIPYGDRMPDGVGAETRIKIAVARAARTSYLTMDGEIDPGKDAALHDRLAASGHWSPFEHPAIAREGRHGNFVGWMPYRKRFASENRTDVDLRAIYEARPEWVRALDVPAVSRR